jgi:hypothetical protein
MSSKVHKRLSSISGQLKPNTATMDLKIPFDPDQETFPKLEELPKIPNAPPGAAWVWGPEDGLGRLNLLTPKRVKEAAKLIETGEVVPVKYGLNSYP